MATTKKAAPTAPAKKTPAVKAPVAKKAAAKPLPDEPEAAPKEMPKGYKMPKTLAQVADMLYETRAKRYEINATVAVLEKVEACLRERLINELPKSNATGIRGKVANVKVETKTVPKLADFDALVGYIAKEHKKNPGIAALIQRRVNDATVKEMWAAGKSIPGVEPLDVPTVSCTKAG
jgi:hypothetical protein